MNCNITTNLCKITIQHCWHLTICIFVNLVAFDQGNECSALHANEAPRNNLPESIFNGSKNGDGFLEDFMSVLQMYKDSSYIIRKKSFTMKTGRRSIHSPNVSNKDGNFTTAIIFSLEKAQPLKPINDNHQYDMYTVKRGKDRLQKIQRSLKPRLRNPEKTAYIYKPINHYVNANSLKRNKSIVHNPYKLPKSYKANAASLHELSRKIRGKDRRFLSNVHSSLKEHINKGQTAWKMSKKQIKKMYDKYDKCLKERLAILKKEEFPIKALLLVEGEKVEMPCTVCYRPDQSEESQKPVWQILRHDTTTVEDIFPEKRFQITIDNSLQVDNIDVSDAGQYFCVDKRDYAAVYQLDVFLTDRRRTLRLGVDPVIPETFLFNHNLRVFTMWTPWGECSTCDRPGHKSRIGQCTAKKIYQDMPVFPRDYAMMALYPEGVPCHSTALPRHLRKLTDISMRDSETQIESCIEKCPTDPPITAVTDESGNVVEVLEPGYHSMKNKPPVLPSLVKRKVLYEKEKSHLVLKCPADVKPELLHWARRDRDVDPGEIKQQTMNRVWLDRSGMLHFKPLLLSDTDVYNCWNKNVREASIKLIVVNEGNQNIKYYISYAGLAATVIGSLICLFCMCCKKSDKNAQ